MFSNTRLTDTGAGRELDIPGCHCCETGHIALNPKVPGKHGDWSRLVSSFREAFALGRVTLAYQPQVCLLSGQTLRWEVLSRWELGPSGRVSPETFMPIVDHLGWQRRYTRWLVQRALDEGRVLTGIRDRNFAFTFNLSPSDLERSELVDDIQRCVEDALAAGVEIGIEMSEKQPIVNTGALIRHLIQLRSVGISIGLDDYGSGFSRLQHLHELPIDFVKIDRSLVGQLHANHKSILVLEATARLVQALGLRAIVEGVENVKQKNLLTQLGFDAAQGYYFGHPRPLDQLVSAEHDR
ncbi:MAG: EAL domain-containing protein [Wenzhouxiangella sp.]|nr:EAL domain-containing protein [Wenzhouxiangella sp.]MCH8478415.1 EAL domain-containing protein [Wenzhouxiangella sp.]